MKKIGIICEFNPLHNGHIYFINTIKKKYPDSILILVLGSYVLQRGDISLISKWNKTALALEYGVDLVLELPTVYNTNGADYFAYYAIKILNEAKIDTLIFGSESNDLSLLQKVASLENNKNFNSKVKKHLASGLNYPTSLNKSLNITLESNDILGLAYFKAIQKINPKIKIETIKRTNKFDDLSSDSDIVSASNIREKLKNKKDISKFIPPYNINMINEIDEVKMYSLLKYKILTDNHLDFYLGVDEGLENKLKQEITKANNYEEYLTRIKSKRYTTSRLKRMLMHILLGIEKTDLHKHYDYKILGFNTRGQLYLKSLKNNNLSFKSSTMENKISLVYYELTKDPSTKLEHLNKPIIKKI